jgi:hypothetical protein
MKKTLLISLSFSTVFAFGQNTYDMVYTMLNTKCTNGACHTSGSGNSLLFDGNSTAVYNALVNQTPANTAAAASGDKYVYVNQPYQSYLLKKCGSWLDTDLGLKANEGNAMQTNASSNLSDKEVEYVRQWIINGAKKTGNTIDTVLINAYYNSTNKTPFLQKPPVPANGKQIRFGPVFLPASNQANTEREFLLKHHINFGTDVEVNQIDGYMNAQSHHFLLFKYQDSAAAAAQPNGLRIVSLTGGVTSFDGNKDLTGAWQDDADIRLPQGTALFWDQNTNLDLNYHVKNYNIPDAMPCDFYLNITYKPRPVNTATIEMKSALINNASLFLLGNKTSTVYYNDPSNGKNETRHLWMMSSHTHKFGTGFVIHEKDASQPNQVGDTLLDGNYSYETGFNKGYYDWEHPSVKYFVPQHAVDMKTKGIRVKTIWNVTQANPVTFGFTTADEMQLFYYMYTNELPLTPNAIVDLKDKNKGIGLYPNPTSNSTTLLIDADKNEEATISVFDLQGKRVYGFVADMIYGENTYKLSNETMKLSTGIYVVKVNTATINKETKLIIN